MPAPSAYLIAGGGGMLGTALQQTLAAQGAIFSAPAERDFDITDERAVSRVIDTFAGKLGRSQTGVLVNAAAYTNIEGAEDDFIGAYGVNERGAELLAQGAHKAGLGFIHISADSVFDGLKEGPYTEEDAPAPLSVYGASKLAGELAVIRAHPEALIVRTAWPFGPGGSSFPREIIDAARTRPPVTVASTEVGSPTYTFDLASGLLGLAEKGATGFFHLAGSGSCSRFELACEVLVLAGLGDVLVQPVTDSEYPSGAMRPRNSVLDCSKAAKLGVSLPHWRDALACFLAGTASNSPRATLGMR